MSEHLKALSQAGLLRAKRIKQWTFYRRGEPRIREIKWGDPGQGLTRGPIAHRAPAAARRCLADGARTAERSIAHIIGG